MGHHLSQQELEEQLDAQIHFLKSSAEAFDRGTRIEAKRIATTLRVLLHDKRQSKSLLQQLGRKVEFWDTATPRPDDAVNHYGLVNQLIGPGTGGFAAFLDGGGPGKLVPFDTWWSAPVLYDLRGNQFSRKTLVLHLADQDGGAHVDPVLPDDYADLSRNNSMGIVEESDPPPFVGPGGRSWTLKRPETQPRLTPPMHRADIPVSGVELASVRQIAHEVLKTIVPGYAMSPSYPPNTFPVQFWFMTDQPLGPPPVAQRAAKVGLNDPCTCGSGRKWKKCHGK